jgi:diadenosine tetraphosphate (Ap4A) HIT family hydrolase
VGATELEHLSGAERGTLMEEIVQAGAAVRAIGEALGRPVEKLNVGQIGNITPQLHLHIVGRRDDDLAWPGPVWGQGAADPYSPEALAQALAAARASLAL